MRHRPPRPAPEGATSTENLGPGCRGHHTAKHAPGFGLLADPDGSMVFETAGGFQHPVIKADQPVGDSWGGEEMWEQPVTYAESSATRFSSSPTNAHEPATPPCYDLDEYGQLKRITTEQRFR